MRSDGGKERIHLDPENFRPADRSDEEWAEWIEAYSANAKGRLQKVKGSFWKVISCHFTTINS
jgi:hypothetical protein